jgi:hypothetical protein
MAYVELLRLRTALMWYGGIFVVAYIVFFLAVHAPGSNINEGGSGDRGQIPLGIIVAGLAWCPMVLATVLGLSLNRENDGVEMVWTKPIARERLALSYILVDLGAIVVAYLISIVFVLFALWTLAAMGHVHTIAFDESVLRSFALGLGIAFMWYALLQAATSWNSGRAGLVVGLSWAVFIFLTVLSQVPLGTYLHAAVVLLNYLNPLAYLSSIGSHSSVRPRFGMDVLSINGLTLGTRLFLVWAIGIVASAIAIAGWKRMEI